MDVGNLVIVAAMFAGAAVMLAGYRRQKRGADWGLVLTVIGAGIALGCAGWSMVGRRNTAGGVIRAERFYEEVSGWKLGATLAERFPNSRALVIVDPSRPPDAAEGGNPILDGLRKGFGDKIRIVKEYTPEMPESVQADFAAGLVPPGAAADTALPDMPTLLVPVEMWFSAEVFDGIVDRYEGRIDIIVSTIGLPGDMDDMDFWGMTDRPELALLGGRMFGLEGAIARGAVCAAVAARPDADYSARRPPRNPDAAFDRRYVLVTAGNVNEIASEYSQIFRQ